jgi:hypothetical protein
MNTKLQIRKRGQTTQMAGRSKEAKVCSAIEEEEEEDMVS